MTKNPSKNNKKLPFYSGTGRRKTSVAGVWLYAKDKSPVDGLVVNNAPIEEYFTDSAAPGVYMRPFQVTDTLGKFCASIKVSGGGKAGQLGAIVHGLARALEEFDGTLRPKLKKEGLLRRDPRMKERKHYFRRKARAKEQWSKR